MVERKERPRPGDFVRLPDNLVLRITEVAAPDAPWQFRAVHPVGTIVLVSNAELTWDTTYQVWLESPTRHVSLPDPDASFVERRQRPRGPAS